MGDAGEGLIDAESRIQERMEDLERERAQKHVRTVRDPERLRVLESLRLARTELERQFSSAAHERRRAQIQEAIDELTRRMTEATAAINS
jgi:predicted nucleic acid-binding Zn ribbon protein